MDQLNNQESTITRVQPGDLPAINRLWEASVRATHHFLKEEDIRFLVPLVKEAFAAHELWCTRDDTGVPTAFLCVEGTNIEMLFVAPENRGQGLGRRLTEHAITHFQATTVDVNEQNEQAVGFYERLGFHTVRRSELDPTGKPFPILHLELDPLICRVARKRLL